MKTKTIPFDLETAKKIQAGKIEGCVKDTNGIVGTIVTFNGSNTPLPIVVKFSFPDGDNIFFVGNDGVSTRIELALEVRDNEPQFKPFDPVLMKDSDTKEYEFKRFDKVKIHLAGDRYDNWIATIAYVHGNLIGVTVNNHPFVYDSKCIELVESYKEKPEFKPFDKVLVREDDLTNWQATFFSHIESFEDGERFAITTSGDNYNLANNEIIPYEGNEHFVGTTDKPKEE